MLITRLIINLGLALLLVVGAAASAHPEQSSVPAAGQAAVSSASDVTSTDEALQGSSQGSDLAISAAICALGVLCGLTLLAAVRNSLRSPGDSPLQRRRRVATHDTAHPRLFAARTLTLFQLGVSRT
jgi:hypothetical protein